MRNKKPELLIPASNLEVLKVAVTYGADAIYIGGEMFSLRAKAKNFSKEDMKEGIAFAHEYGKKVYVTANITAHNRDLGAVRDALESAGYSFLSAEVAYIPQTMSAIDDEEAVKKMEKLIDMLEENDDVQAVWHNWEMPDEDDED